MTHPKTRRCWTCANSRAAIVAAAIVVWSGLSAAEITSELTSNEIWRLAGRGDTLWMATSAGLNYTIATQDSLRWWGYKDKSLAFRGFVPMAFGGGAAVVALPAATRFDAPLWTYSHKTAMIGSARITWNVGVITQDTLKDAAYYIYDVLWTPAAFWFACQDGGLVRIDTSAIAASTPAATVFVPGINKAAFASSSFPAAGRPHPDTSRGVISIEAGTDSAGLERIWVATRAKIFVFTPGDTTWDSLPATLTNTNLTVKEFQDVYVSSAPGTAPLVFAPVLTADRSAAAQSDTVNLYRYGPSGGLWQFYDRRPSSLVFGRGDTVYLVVDDKIYGSSRSVPPAAYPGLESSAFNARLGAAPTVTDIMFAPHDSDGNLWIATLQGLYYSRHERRDEKGDSAFLRAFRAPYVKSGLKDSYLFPGILTPDRPFGRFAYNLARDARVTIRIYDWNRDLVKTVIADRPRKAGSGRRAGRSTDEQEDLWDGTNQLGKAVAPGVYYYKISASTGEHSFGKIIVAK